MNKTFEWEKLPGEILWYLVGLIVSDGSLSVDKRHIDITAKDKAFLRKIKVAASLPQRVTAKSNGRGQTSHHIQIGSVSFYRFLISIGLMSNKSKRLGMIKVPEKHFAPFLRGVIDGDGGIRNWVHPGNGHEQWSLRIVSGSRHFLTWLRKETARLMRAKGKLYRETGAGFDKFVLKYGKMSAIEICRICYTDLGNALWLDRKYQLALKCVSSRRGWNKSKTVF